jgi:hypothetical protein
VTSAGQPTPDAGRNEETITLVQHVLGLEPYVLLIMRQGDEGPDDLRLAISAGGGIDDEESIRQVLEAALEGFTGVAGAAGE